MDSNGKYIVENVLELSGLKILLCYGCGDGRNWQSLTIYCFIF